MKRVLIIQIIFILFITGCAPIKDYKGVIQNLNQTPWIILNINRDTSDEDIFYICAITNGNKILKSKQEKRKILKQLAEENGYKSWKQLSLLFDDCKIMDDKIYGAISYEFKFFKNEN